LSIVACCSSVSTLCSGELISVPVLSEKEHVMTELASVIGSNGDDSEKAFSYQRSMEMLCYMPRKTSYISDGEGQYLSRLYDLYEQRVLVGFQLWGIRRVMERMFPRQAANEDGLTAGELIRCARAMEVSERYAVSYTIVLEHYGRIVIPQKTLQLMQA
jgi:hypothetical protein